MPMTDPVGALTIETPRLILRGWRDADLEPWIAMNADPRVTEYLGRTYSREFSESRFWQMREELQRVGYGWWAVEARGGPSFAGVIILREVPFQARFTPAREIGWRFAHDMWGRGYATEGAGAALALAFDRFDWHEVVAMTAEVNTRSRRVMERLGMTYDRRDDFEHPNLAEGHPLRRHALYRIRRPDA
jgi:RimJ/RimL family protein N-acetyltransferase